MDDYDQLYGSDRGRMYLSKAIEGLIGNANLVSTAQITIKEADNKHAQIVLSNCDLAYVGLPRYLIALLTCFCSFANSLRRIMLAEVPTVG